MFCSLCVKCSAIDPAPIIALADVFPTESEYLAGLIFGAVADWTTVWNGLRSRPEKACIIANESRGIAAAQSQTLLTKERERCVLCTWRAHLAREMSKWKTNDAPICIGCTVDRMKSCSVWSLVGYQSFSVKSTKIIDRRFLKKDSCSVKYITMMTRGGL